jgi:hypothetical protein
MDKSVAASSMTYTAAHDESVKFEGLVQSCEYLSPLSHVSVISGAVLQTARDLYNESHLLHGHIVRLGRA